MNQINISSEHVDKQINLQNVQYSAKKSLI